MRHPAALSAFDGTLGGGTLGQLLDELADLFDDGRLGLGVARGTGLVEHLDRDLRASRLGRQGVAQRPLGPVPAATRRRGAP